MRRHINARVLGPLLAAVVLGAGLVGCGGSSPQSLGDGVKASTSPGPGSHANTATAGRSGAGLIAKADTICSRVNREIAASQPKSTSTAEILKLTPLHARIERQGLTELALLVPATEAEALHANWDSILSYRKALVEQLLELVRDARRKDTSAIDMLASSKAHTHAQLIKAATAAGFKDCGTVG